MGYSDIAAPGIEYSPVLDSGDTKMKNSKDLLPLSTTLHASAPSLRWLPPPSPPPPFTLIFQLSRMESCCANVNKQDRQLKQTEPNPSEDELELGRLVARGWGADSAAVVTCNCCGRFCLSSGNRRRVVWLSRGWVVYRQGKQGLHSSAKPDVVVGHQGRALKSMLRVFTLHSVNRLEVLGFLHAREAGGILTVDVWHENKNINTAKA
ncbi:unnamed protein product [Ectocarpus sp. 8 AP-2014]